MIHYFAARAGLVRVKVRFAGPSGDTSCVLAVDTAAVTTTLPPETVHLTGIQVSHGPEGEVLTAGGRRRAPLLNVAWLEALGQRKRDLEVMCIDLGPDSTVDGVLGLNFLRHFDLRINFKRGYITLH